MIGSRCSTEMRPLRYPPKKVKKLTSGVNDLQTLAPEVAKEITSHDPAQILAGSNTKVRWECSICGDEWESPVRSRTAGLIRRPGCPECNRKRAMERRSVRVLLKSEAPEIYKELRRKQPDLSAGAHIEVEWICRDEGHVYLSTPNKRLSGRSCPYCAWREPLPGFNTLADVRPDLVSSLVDLSNANVIANSKERVEWTHYAEGVEHRWTAPLYGRIFHDTQCAVCDGRVCIPGINDWRALLDREDFEFEWSDNNKDSPDGLHWGQRRLVVCRKHEHPYERGASFTELMSRDVRCFDCNPPKTFTSLGEEAVADFIALEFPELLVERNVRRFKKQGLYEIDIFVENSLAIHYDGTYWHQEGVFKPVGYHETRDSVESGLGLQSFVVEEASWTGDSEVVKERLRKVLSDLCEASEAPGSGGFQNSAVGN